MSTTTKKSQLTAGEATKAANKAPHIWQDGKLMLRTMYEFLS